MTKKLILFSVLFSSLTADAGELIIVKGFAQGPMKTPTNQMVAQAKAEAITNLPHSKFRKISEWSGYVYNEQHLQTKFVMAEAAFADSDDKGPLFITHFENRMNTWSDAEVPYWIQRSKDRASADAAIYCGGAVRPPLVWDVVVTPVSSANSTSTRYDIETTAKFECDQANEVSNEI